MTRLSCDSVAPNIPPAANAWHARRTMATLRPIVLKDEPDHVLAATCPGSIRRDRQSFGTDVGGVRARRPRPKPEPDNKWSDQPHHWRGLTRHSAVSRAPTLEHAGAWTASVDAQLAFPSDAGLIDSNTASPPGRGVQVRHSAMARRFTGWLSADRDRHGDQRASGPFVNESGWPNADLAGARSAGALCLPLAVGPCRQSRPRSCRPASFVWQLHVIHRGQPQLVAIGRKQ